MKKRSNAVTLTSSLLLLLLDHVTSAQLREGGALVAPKPILTTVRSSSVPSRTADLVCRTPAGYLTLQRFATVSCAQCYAFTFPDHELKVYRDKLIHVDDLEELEFGILRNESRFNIGYAGEGIRMFEADPEDSESGVLAYFRNKRERNDWVECCRAARRCCQTIAIEPGTNSGGPHDYDKGSRPPSYTPSSHPYTTATLRDDNCPATWDGWECWPDTKSNVIASKHCPTYILAGTFPLASDERVTKVCQSNASWYQVYDPTTERFKEWSNYTLCLKIDHFYRRHYVRIGAYVVSMISIIPALVIFAVFKQLKCSRVSLHQNLLLALLLKGITVVIFDIIFTFGNDSASDGYSKFSPILCNYLAVFNKYLLVATYCWMFNEGFYLHNILIYALKTKDSLKLYYLFGWGFPIIPLIIYLCLKRSQEFSSCWVMAASMIDWVINSVCIFILLMNVIFLIRIIRIIVIKLKTDVHKDHVWHRQTLKAILFLVPLFGVQILLTLYRPQLSNGFLEIYHILNSLIEGLQGFCVALIFCYFNGEVINKIRSAQRKSHTSMQMLSQRHDFQSKMSKIDEMLPLN